MATEYSERYIIIIPAPLQAKANTAAKEVDTVGGENTFTVGLIPESQGTPPITHYWCNWQMKPSEYGALCDAFSRNGVTPHFIKKLESWDPVAAVTKPADVLAVTHMKRINQEP